MTLDHIPGAAKLSGDVVSAGIVVGTLAQLLPSIAALLTIIWTGIRIYETPTVQRLLTKFGLVAGEAGEGSSDGE